MQYSDIHVSQQTPMFRIEYLSHFFNKKIGIKLCGMLLGLSLIACVSLAQAQSFFGDTQGKSALLNEEIRDFNTSAKTTLSANTANNSADLMYIWQKTPDSSMKWAFKLSGRAVNGVTNLFNNGGRSSEAIGNMFVGYRFGKNKENSETSEGSPQQVMLELGLCRGTYNLVSSDNENMPDTATAAEENNAIEENNAESQTFPSMFLHYNRLFNKRLLGGLSIGYVRQSNHDTLDERQIVKSRMIEQTEVTPTDTEENLVISRLAAREGDYDEFDTWRVNADLLYVPDFEGQKIGFNLFFRYTNRPGQSMRHLFEPGFGIFKLKSNQSENKENEQGEQAGGNEAKITGISPLASAADTPWKIVYGIIGQWNAIDEEFRFGLVAGYNF